MPRLRLLYLIPASAALLVPGIALAHGDEASESGWSFEPLAAVLLTCSVALYALGWARMRASARQAIAPWWRVSAYVAAVVTLIIALFSPLDAAADTSFAWHMAQHLMLMLLAAPLMALANTHLVALFALPIGPRRRIGRLVNRAPGVRSGASSRSAPIWAAVAFALGLWLWHAPAAYDLALADPALHTIEHLTFLVTSAIFWRMVSTSGDRRLDGGSAIVLVTLVGLQGNLMAALITLAPTPIYQHYTTGGLADQQVAGLLMWVPAGLLYLGSTCWAIYRLVSPSTKRRQASAPIDKLRFLA
ncbi:cytochrome c oxidase assembly protein [Sphingomonas sp. 10B4]|uniref:cytochrome c oxidase assembly protein n=1 Tax=Sphingomonas sp. 10B4 TaxID=3048575 RepID=UPI002AB4CD9F|nr:cytochrome c oxidase assembly protein [Sphingomonas sp. 10B4]MDY7524613.1 cytochrome c oxidase assembly protein [Sphingomonas sp. 10B4]MEB0282430.1 cytochrome c oxidase assembly protein [Sphingomonas sp. 10B4]